MMQTLHDPIYGAFTVGDTVEFIGTGFADLHHGDHGTIVGFDERSMPSRPIIVQFPNTFDRRIPVGMRYLDILESAGESC